MREALIAAILEDPDDDLPRLAYADWCEENGDDARADFIRVQIERTRLPSWDGRQGGLAARERRLLSRHGRAWAPAGPCLVWFRRGFVERVSASMRTLLAVGDELDAGHPVQDVDVWREGKPHEGRAVGPLTRMRFWRRVRTLTNVAGDIEGWRGRRELTMKGMRRLCAGRWMTGLRRLNLGDPRDTEDGVGFRALLASPSLGTIRRLEVCGVRLPEEALSELLSDRFPALREVEVGWLGRRQTAFLRDFLAEAERRGWYLSPSVRDDEEYDRHLALCVGRGLVRSLRFGGGGSPEPLFGLRSWGVLERLEAAPIPGAPLDWAAPLRAHPGLAGIRVLQIHGGPEEILERDYPSLESLMFTHERHVGGAIRPGRAFAALTRPGAFPRLRDLWLDFYDVSPEEMRGFLTSPVARGLRRLHLGCCALRPETLRELAHCPHPLQVNELHVGLSGRADLEHLLAFVRNDAFADLTCLSCRYHLPPGAVAEPYPPEVLAECLASPRLTFLLGIKQENGDGPLNSPFGEPTHEYGIIGPHDPRP